MLQTPRAYINGVDGKIGLTVTGGAINAGEHTALASIDDTNYVLKNESSGYYINKAETKIYVSDIETKYTYNGLDQTLNGLATINHIEANIVYKGNDFKDAGRYEVTISVAETANYTGNIMVISVYVEKANLVITADKIESLKADEKLTYTVEGLVGDDTIKDIDDFDIYRDKGSDPGIYKIFIAGTSNNYKIDKNSSTYTILSPKPIETVDSSIDGQVSSESGMVEGSQAYLWETETDTFANVKKDIIGTYAVDIYYKGDKLDGADKTYNVKMKAPKELSALKTYSIVMIDSNGEEVIIDVVIEDGYMVFETANLGDFAIVEDGLNLGSFIVVLVILNIAIGSYIVYDILKKKKQKLA